MHEILDIVIPVYNEGKNILKTLSVLNESVQTSTRILICYDRDDDNTLPPLQNLSNSKHPIVFVKNRSKGVHGAVMSGFEASPAAAVLVFPADDIFNAGIIDKMAQHFQEGADIVAASRFVRGGCMKGCPWLKAVLVRLAAFSLYHAARIPTHDPTNGFRLFSKKVLREIPVESSEGFAFSIELLVKAHRRRLRVDEIPALWIEREERKSRFRIFKWLPIYLRWYFYAFATTYLRKKS